MKQIHTCRVFYKIIINKFLSPSNKWVQDFISKASWEDSSEASRGEKTDLLTLAPKSAHDKYSRHLKHKVFAISTLRDHKYCTAYGVVASGKSEAVVNH